MAGCWQWRGIERSLSQARPLLLGWSLYRQNSLPKPRAGQVFNTCQQGVFFAETPRFGRYRHRLYSGRVQDRPRHSGTNLSHEAQFDCSESRKYAGGRLASRQYKSTYGTANRWGGHNIRQA